MPTGSKIRLRLRTSHLQKLLGLTRQQTYDLFRKNSLGPIPSGDTIRDLILIANLLIKKGILPLRIGIESKETSEESKGK